MTSFLDKPYLFASAALKLRLMHVSASNDREESRMRKSVLVKVNSRELADTWTASSSSAFGSRATTAMKLARAMSRT